jgi:ferric iron reductase protein FhuF
LAVVEGPRAQAHLARALGQVADALPYLCALVGPPGVVLSPGAQVEEGGWLKCEELLGDEAWLEATIRSTGRCLGTSSGAVAASLFVLGYSYRVLTLALACLLMGGALPQSRPEAMAVSLSKGRATVVAYRRAEVLLLDDEEDDGPLGPSGYVGNALITDAIDAMVEEAVEGHLRLLVGAVRSRIRIGRRLLWGNVAASAAFAFQAMEGLLGDRVKPLGEHFFLVAPQELQGQGAFVSLAQGGRRAWHWERTNCCLNDHLPEHIRCNNCSLVPVEERRARYLASVADSL